MGASFSLLAIVSGIAPFWIVIEHPNLFYFAFLGVGGLWAVFTGLRKLWDFDKAHLNLAWHDWVGELFGVAINSFILYAMIDDLHRYVTGKYWSKDFCLTFPPYVYLSIVPMIFAVVVIVRWVKSQVLK